MRHKIGRMLGMALSILAPTLCGLMLYDRASEHEYLAFWDDSPRAAMLYGKAPGAKFAEAYRRAAASARARGFVFSDPRLVSPNALFDLWYVRWTQSPLIAVSRDEGKVLKIDEMWMVRFTDDDLECVMAHEIGHVIDFQRRSEQHPFMGRIACLDAQQRADEIARLLCGHEQFNRVIIRYQIARPLAVKSCGGAPVR